ncbi:MAG: hypothetical protein ACJ8DC_17605 [Gemmatimonadales bacterium]
MTVRDDPLARPMAPDRLFYATGTLLAAEDFTAEQLYHRFRLARALTYLHGTGTIAGLRVRWEPGQPGKSDRLLVEPGLAIDRFGRLIEVSRTWCLKLNDWFQARTRDELVAARRADFALVTADETANPPTLVPTQITGVVADVFLQFVACERGLTPSFQQGPFDALDAVAPSRLRDSSALELVIRDDPNPQTPEDPWAAVAIADGEHAASRALRRAALDAWREGKTWLPTGQLNPLREHKLNQDLAAVFLARVVIPAQEPESPDKPPLRGADPVLVDNYSRQFVHSSPALAHALGL